MASKPQNTVSSNTPSQVRNKFIALLALSIISVVIVAPGYVNTGIDRLNEKTKLGLPHVPDKNFNFGLDLQGGAHLIYQADTAQIAPLDRGGAVEGVRDVIERRVRGGLGVSEPLVQTTRVGESYRIIVELPGVTDVNQAIKMIGETPVLEFKEQNNDPPRDLTLGEKKELDAFNVGQEKKAKEAALALRQGKKFEEVVALYSEDEKTKSKGGDLGFVAFDTYPELYTWAKTQKIGQVSPAPVKSFEGLNIVKLAASRDGGKRVSAAHLLLCYKGAERCENPQYSSREEAAAKIAEIKKETTIQNFADMVKKYSTEPGASARGGDLGSFKKGDMVLEFENAVWDAQSGAVVGPVETKFGYHLIYKKSEETLKEYQLFRVFLKLKQKTDIVPPQEPWKPTGLSGKQLKRAEVTDDTRTGAVQVSLQFDDEGTKLFSEITTRNTGKPVAIFLDNQPISIPRVNEPITSGSAVITGGFGYADARLLAQRLNSGALPVPVELLSQQKVDATLGADSLAKSFKAGLAGLLLVMLFMTIYYRLSGLLSVFSLGIYTALNLALFKVLGVTLTLSGIAGFILSIGMAVDANVLVFERLKEELRLGKSLRSAMEESFLRAWPSIRDGHVTTLIGCAVLVWFGTGFVQGFAVVLGTGVLVSLFTAITVTRTIMRLVFARFKESNWLFLGFKKGND